MFTFILTWEFRGRTVHSAFSHGYRRRKCGRRMLLVPGSAATMEDLTTEEIGQLLVGN